MHRKKWKKTIGSRIWTLCSSLLLFAFVFVLVLSGLGNADEAVRAEALRTAEAAIRRAAVSCYALEGAYPESYAYLRENYGLAVDEAHYAVHYSIFASNIMPEITVVELEG